MFAFDATMQQLAADRSASSVAALGVGLKELATLRAALDACEATLLSLFDRAHGWRRTGAVDQVAWLRTETGISSREAATKVRVAEVLDDLPEAARALADGDITAGHVHALAKADPAIVTEHADDLIERAQEMSADAFDRHVRSFIHRHSEDDGAERYERQLRQRSAKSFTDDDGMAMLVARLDTVSGAIVTGAMDKIAEELWQADQPVDLAARRADALVEMARRALAVDPADARMPVPLVTVVIDHQTLLGQVAATGHACHLADGSPLPAATARRLACQAGILPMVLDGDSQPLDVGRTHRLPTPGQRRALLVRDRGCVFPGCDRPPGWCEVHHLIPWERGGPTDLGNLGLLCPRHHHTVHDGGWDLRRARDGTWTATGPDGRLLTREQRPCLLAG